MKRIMIWLVAIACGLPALAQKRTLDIPGMYQLINQSQDEFKLQVPAKNQQAANMATEQANSSLLDRLKTMYRTLQQRYNMLGTLVSAADLSIYAAPMVRQILTNQGRILQLVEKDPAVAALGYQAEIEFAEKAKALAGYIAGLILSAGDINQMKASDRKLLVDYAIQQLSWIQELSGNMLGLLLKANLASTLHALNPFQTWVDRDVRLAKNIAQNAKYVK